MSLLEPTGFAGTEKGETRAIRPETTRSALWLETEDTYSSKAIEVPR